MLGSISCMLALLLAHAGDVAPTPELPPREERRLELETVSDEPTAADVQGEPPADEAGGESVKEDETNELLWVPRVLLFPVRVVYEIPGQALRGGAWLVERYRIRDVYEQIFFNEEGTFGVFPTAFFETGFGLNVGARMIYRNVFGHGEALSVRAGYGGQFRQTLLAQFRSGALFGTRFRLELLANNEARPRARFFGIGNSGDLAPPPTNLPISPFDTSVAINGRYAEERTRGQADLRYFITRYLFAAMSVGWLAQSFNDCSGCTKGDAVANVGDTQGVNVADVYDTSKLVGFEHGLSSLTYGLALSYDSREPLNDFIPKPTPSRGWRANLFAGYTNGYNQDPSSFGRLGMDVARVFNVLRGNRTLTLRVYAETVLGELDRIPFVMLPQLGGNFVLRAENIGRFRDRNAASLSTEYMWALNQGASSFIFVDSGRVWRSDADLQLAHIHLGGGVGLQLHTKKTFLLRMMVGYNGDMVRFALSLDPLYNISPRAEW